MNDLKQPTEFTLADTLRRECKRILNVQNISYMSDKEDGLEFTLGSRQYTLVVFDSTDHTMSLRKKRKPDQS